MRVVGIGHQDFSRLIENNYFYIDKTEFIREWWESGDLVTLIARPRRFGKTLNMSMLEQFFSVSYAGRKELFEGLSVWKDEGYRELQGTYPVISLSFANVKETNYYNARRKICQLLEDLYTDHTFLLKSGRLEEAEQAFFRRVTVDMEDTEATMALHHLAKYLSRYYGKKVIILLDEYDTPMQEAYMYGYWQELTELIRSMFNSSFKTNTYLERAVLTGITRVSKESIFSDLNHLEVVTTTSEKYADSFGFTEEEVFLALDEFGLSERKQEVKTWYDGFTFGKKKDIYNPWSVINYLSKRKPGAYWANTSSNSLIGKLVREGTGNMKECFERLLQGGSIRTLMDEQIVFSMLEHEEDAVWSLFVASGYMKVKSTCIRTYETGEWENEYELELTNLEVRMVLRRMVRNWFARAKADYNDFVKALLLGDVEAMNEYMNRVALETFSSFDTGKHPAKSEPERFYHGFVLGLMVELAGRYALTSNRESGFGRYDVMLEPLKEGEEAFILEFKVFQPQKEQDLQDTVKSALAQIEEKNYAAGLLAKGIPQERIRSYGFAFQGRTVLIG